MKRLNLPSSPREIFEIPFADSRMVGTASFELSKSGFYTAQWWVSGLVGSGVVRLLTKGQCALLGVELEDAVEELGRMSELIKQLAKSSAAAEGLTLPSAASNSDERAEMARLHIRELTSKGVLPLPGTELAFRTAMQFELCKSFGVSKLIELIADYEIVPVTTIRRRIAKSRDLGFIPKSGNTTSRDKRGN